jgi:alpha-glucoside transport system permease protein
MSTTTDHEPNVFSVEAAATMGVGDRLRRVFSSVPTGVLWLIVIVWTIPTIGLFVSSFRPLTDVANTGWWHALWPTNWGDFTLSSYDTVLFEDGSSRRSMWTHFLNSLAIVIPASIIPIAMAAFAAYAFAWMDFRGKNWLFVGIVSMMALPNQMAFVPLLKLYNNGASWTVPFTDFTMKIFPDLQLDDRLPAATVWLTHTSFGLPLAIFLLHNYMSTLPRDMFEAARIDGADHFTIFWRLALPLARPALAAFGIFQFLWVWNDFLIASVFLSGEGEPMTVALVNLVGNEGRDFELRFAAAFVTIVVPLIVFFSMQKHFVRGLMAGSVKG